MPNGNHNHKTVAEIRNPSLPKTGMAKETRKESYPCCVYCGDWFQCRDHVVPISWLRVYRDYRSEEIVPCCMMCNSLAGNYKPDSIAEKAFYLLRRYESRYWRVLALPLWTFEELDELRGGLKQKVKADQALRELILAKLENLDLVSAGYQPCKLNPDGFRAFAKRSHE